MLFSGPVLGRMMVKFWPSLQITFVRGPCDLGSHRTSLLWHGQSLDIDTVTWTSLLWPGHRCCDLDSHRTSLLWPGQSLDIVTVTWTVTGHRCCNLDSPWTSLLWSGQSLDIYWTSLLWSGQSLDIATVIWTATGNCCCDLNSHWTSLLWSGQSLDTATFLFVTLASVKDPLLNRYLKEMLFNQIQTTQQIIS